MTLPEIPTPIAVVGASCRFPGGAHDLESLWDLLAQGRNAWSEIPVDRFNGKASYHPARGSRAAHTHKGGHFLDEDIGAFDAEFFGISADEANAMDPQQRIQLEVAYQALESAGIPVESIKRSNTGVYIATFTHDYENMIYKDVLSLPKYFMTGVGQAIVSNRISYTFDLRGPSMTLDTGCSGSLVALHQACQSLRSGETSMGLVGGTNLILNPDTMIPMDALHLLNFDGKCYSFDSRGAGYGRGEGVAMVVLKRLDDALRSGDPIRTIIRNTAIGQDGKTSGITLPSGVAQQQLIRSTYASVLLDPCDVGYVEAHGTGTIAGDLSEMDAIEKVFCKNRKHQLYVGSIKANVGHLESTSGLAGLIKALLVLEKGQIPSTPSLKVLKGSIQQLSSDIMIPQVLERWHPDVVKRASINSFGYGGANAHAIIDAADTSSVVSNHEAVNVHDAAFHKSNMTSRLQLFTVTARSERSLQMALRRLHAWTKSRDSALDLVDLAYTLTSRRSLMQWRYSFVACTHQQLLDSLKVVSIESVRMAKTNRLSYIFGGQGAQWYAMGRELVSIPYFKMSLAECALILKNLGESWNLFDEFAKDEDTSRLDDSKLGQPAITILQIGLVDLMNSLGLMANEVLGHSSGEIAAAYAAGALSKAAAIKIAYHRSFLAERSKSLMSVGGAMLAVALGEEETGTYIDRISAGRVVVACCNSPLNTTVSGDSNAIDDLKDSLDRFAISSRRLKVDTAYHSHHMDAVAEEYFQNLRGLEAENKRMAVKFYSSVTGDEKTSGFGPSYWVENLVSKVRFREALEKLCRSLHQKSIQSSVCHNFIEIGPHSTLVPSVKQTLKHLNLEHFRYNCISTLRKDCNSHETFFQAIGSLFEQGFPVDLDAVNSLESTQCQRRVVTNLPPYPFDHSVSYWHESRLQKEHRMRQPYHDLLGLRMPGDTCLEPTWRHLISVQTLPWLRDHTIDSRMVFPASGYIAMAIEAKTQVYHEYFADSKMKIQKYVLSDIVLSNTLEVPENDSVEVRLTLRHSVDDAARGPTACREFRVSSVCFNGTVKEHCCGHIALKLSAFSDDAKDEPKRYEHIAKAQLQRLHTVQRAQYPRFDPASIYDDMRSNGHHWGPDFARITSLSAGDNEATGTILVPDVAQSMPGSFMQPHVIHPATLDALIHSGLMLFAKTYGMSLIFPVAMDEVIISADALATPNEDIHFVTTMASTGISSVITTIAAFPKTSGSEADLLVYIKDGLLKGTMNPGADLDGRYAETCSQVEWGADIDICNPPFSATSPEDDVLRNLKMASLSQIVSQFVGSCLDQTNVTDVQQSYSAYFSWMKQLHHPHGIKVADEDLNLRLLSLGVEGEALHRIGSNLKSIITGDSDPLSLLLQDDLLSRVYAEDTAHLRCYAHLIDYVERIVFKKPGSRVLEIGAGTGGASLPLIRALRRNEGPSIGQYDFTDVSSGFFEDARSKLAEWEDCVKFKTLDIGRDPIQQGFSEGDYDIVLASNTLHAAKSVDDAIANARKLLKPGGRLLLIEITKLTSFTNAIFGVLPGWYMERHDGRKGSPTLSVEQWNSRLRQGSFSGVDLMVPDYNGSAQQMALMISKAISPASCPIDVSIIVNPDYNNASCGLSQSLEVIIKHQHGRVNVEQLPLRGIQNDKTYVVIDGDRDPMLTEATHWLSASVTNLLQQAQNVLWLVISYLPDVSEHTPRLNLRVPRIIQFGNENLKLVRFGIPHAEHLSDLCSKIFEVMRVSFYGPAEFTSQETEYIYADGSVLIPRILPSSKLRQVIQQESPKKIQIGPYRQKDRLLKLDLEISGAPNEDFPFTEAEFEGPLAPSDIEVEVHAWGIDAQAVFAKSNSIVAEFSGRVVNAGADIRTMFRVGDRVCCWGGTPYCSFSRVNAMKACHLPDSIPFNIAATVPVTFSIAYHGIAELTGLTKGHTVLIHAATESTGEAAVRIAQCIGAEIIVTAEGAETQNLARIFGLPTEQVLSRTSDIAWHVGILTEGRGVDVIFSTTEYQSFEEDCACLKPLGKYVEVKKTGAIASRKATLLCQNKSIVLGSVNFEVLTKHRSLELKEQVKKVLSWLDEGLLKPLHHIGVNDISEIANVYKSMQRGSNTGKQVLEVTKDSIVKWTAKRKPPRKLSQYGSFILAGELGQWGLDICRYVASREVQYIALLPWATQESGQLNVFENELRRLGISVRVISIRPSDQQEVVRSSVFHALNDWPPVKGVIQAEMLQGSSTSDPAIFGQSVLTRICQDLELDFFVKLAPGTNLFSRQREDACGSSRFPHATTTERLDQVQMLIGASQEWKIVSQHLRPLAKLNQRAMLGLRSIGFRSLLDHATSLEAKSCSRKVIVSGFDRKSLEDAGYDQALKNPILNHIQHPEDPSNEQKIKPNSIAAEGSLADAQNEDEARRIVTTALQHKMSSVTFDYDITDLQTAVTDFGLDSLIIFRVRTWIFQTFRADVEPHEISRAPNIVALASLVLQRTTSTQYRQRTDKDRNCDIGQTEPNPGSGKSSRPVGLPRQPLPPLADTLQAFLISVRPFCSDKEYEETAQDTENFRAPSSMGNVLHQRLVERAEDPQIENWLADLYLDRRYLSLRNPLVAHQSYFGTHPLSRYAMRPAERAAIVTLAVLRFKQALDSGNLGTQYLSGQAVDPDSYQWLFNACREPGLGIDRIRKYANNDYIVVMRRGHFYKITLDEDTQYISFATLRALFERILESGTKTLSWLSIMTADERNEWAKFRSELLGISEENKTSIQTIEAAAFVVCLDNATPADSEERFRQFLFSDGSNRWYDKTLQIVICDNGVSATVCEHAALDGLSVEPLHDFINNAIMNFERPPHPNTNDQELENIITPTTITLKSNAAMDDYVIRFSQRFQIATLQYSFANVKIGRFGIEFFSGHKCPVQSGIQLAIQLASRRFFGYSPPALETVSMATFRKGRVEVHHIIQPRVAEFLIAATEPKIPRAKLRNMAFEAAKAHAKSLSRASKGHGFSRHMLAMEWMIREGESTPKLFESSVYAKMKPAKMMTSTFKTGWAEGGFVYPLPGSILVYFEIKAQSVSFSIFGHDVSARDFRDHLQTAAEEIKTLLPDGESKDP